MINKNIAKKKEDKNLIDEIKELQEYIDEAKLRQSTDNPYVIDTERLISDLNFKYVSSGSIGIPTSIDLTGKF